MSEHVDKLNLPPFPMMEWEEYEWWEGSTDQVFDNEVGLMVTPLEPSVSRTPSFAQREAFDYLVKEDDKVLDAILIALWEHYEDIRPRYVDFLDDELDELMPVIKWVQIL